MQSLELDLDLLIPSESSGSQIWVKQNHLNRGLVKTQIPGPHPSLGNPGSRLGPRACIFWLVPRWCWGYLYWGLSDARWSHRTALGVSEADMHPSLFPKVPSPQFLTGASWRALSVYEVTQMIKEVKMENKKTPHPHSTTWTNWMASTILPYPEASIIASTLSVKKSHQLSVVVGCSSSPAKQKAGLYYILLVPEEKLPKETSL